MLNIKAITDALDALDETINAVTQSVDVILPSDKKQLVEYFAPFFKACLTRFKSAEGNVQAFHFAVIYGLVQLHSDQIYNRLVSTQTARGYFQSYLPYAQIDPSQKYYNALYAFLTAHENAFQAFRRSHYAKQYIKYDEKDSDGSDHDPDFHLGFSFGPEMTNETNWDTAKSHPTTFIQLEKRIYAITFFTMATKGIREYLPTPYGTALRCSALRRNEIAMWNTKIGAILSTSDKSNATLKALLPQNAPETVNTSDVSRLKNFFK